MGAEVRPTTIGPPGPKGDTGDRGLQGPQGAVGAKGDTGAVGAAGPQGNVGSQGSTGPKGDTGSQGAVGPQGNAGPQGAAGQSFNWRGAWSNTTAYAVDDAVRASDGSSYIAVQANTGHDPVADTTQTYWSLSVIHGAVGPQGPQGAQGIQGATGAIGPQGTAGATGPQGAIGPMGPGNLFVSASAPSSPPSTYVWIQTGLGASGTNLTMWVEDGAP